jgi:hypothetical protein
VVAVFAVNARETPLIVVGLAIKYLQKKITLSPKPGAPVESNLVTVTGRIHKEPLPL